MAIAAFSPNVSCKIRLPLIQPERSQAESRRRGFGGGVDLRSSRHMSFSPLDLPKCGGLKEKHTPWIIYAQHHAEARRGQLGSTLAVTYI